MERSRGSIGAAWRRRWGHGWAARPCLRLPSAARTASAGLGCTAVNTPDDERNLAAFRPGPTRRAGDWRVQPGELPMEQPTKFELVFNRRVARTIGYMIPPSLLVQAEEVIE
jgi:hypothetical protein